MKACSIPSFATPCTLNLSRTNLKINSKSSIQANVNHQAATSCRSITRRDLGKFILSTATIATSLYSTGAIAGQKKAPVFIKDESGIQYYDIKPGSGAGPIDGDFVIIDYLAFLSNGNIFDNRKGFVFQLGQRQVIPGLEAAVASMKPGGERRVVVPASLAYGDKGVCVPEKEECLVPPGERLGYDVTLQRVAIPPT